VNLVATTTKLISIMLRHPTKDTEISEVQMVAKSGRWQKVGAVFE
jgi:hypothetical protein